MGIFSSLKAALGGANATPLVSLVFADLDKAPSPDRQPYTYVWGLETPPSVGARVFVEGLNGGDSPAVVVSVGVTLPPGYKESNLSRVKRLATPAEVSAAGHDLIEWLDMARRAAGLPTVGRVRTRPPRGFDSIPPATGDADAEEAGERGRGWWKVFKTAEEAGRPREEVQAYRSIAYRWYAIRDKG